MADPRDKLNRREFLKQSAWVAGGLVVSAVGLPFLIESHAIEPKVGELLRPPGSIEEDEFLYACIKCGLCVQICPVHAIKLADVDEGLGYATPYINAREQACDFSCDSIQCAETCPTAALNFKIFRNASTKKAEELQPLVEKGELDPMESWRLQIHAMKEATRIGVAKVNDQTCLAYQGKGFKGTPRGKDFKGVLRYEKISERKPQPVREQYFDREICDLCVIHCPIGETAIKMVEKELPDGRKTKVPEVERGCTGCGTCEMICPTEPASIVVLPQKTYEEVYS